MRWSRSRASAASPARAPRWTCWRVAPGTRSARADAPGRRGSARCAAIPARRRLPIPWRRSRPPVRAERRTARASRAAPAAAVGPPPLPLRHPATLVAALALAVCALISVSYPIFDPDIWQHLLVGKVIWATRAVPRLHLWSWTTYGEPEVLPSWLFRTLVWPFWAAGGPLGLFVWRWGTTLATLGIAWAASRRMEARGLAPLVALALAARILAVRSQVRPETLVGPLLALEIWILETRRNGGPDRSVALIPIAMVWANAHLSWFL